MLRRLSLSIAVAGATIAIAPVAAQSAPSPMSPDERAVREADDAFWRAFNACDAAAMTPFLADDVEFYHDMTGLTRSRDAVAASLMKGPCGTPHLRMRRELVVPSLFYQAIPGYGAMLAGEHIFYAKLGDAPEKAATDARFLVIWKLQSGHWLMTRIVSYDHRSVPYRPPATSISISPDVLKRYVGRYRTGAGDVDVAVDKDRLVLRSGGLQVTLAASAPNRFFALERDLRIVFADTDAPTIKIEGERSRRRRGPALPLTKDPAQTIAPISACPASRAECDGIMIDSRLSEFMSEPLTTIERAIQLAQSGDCRSVNDVRQRLRHEGYIGIGIELAGVAINRELVDYLHAARH